MSTLEASSSPVGAQEDLRGLIPSCSPPPSPPLDDSHIMAEHAPPTRSRSASQTSHTSHSVQPMPLVHAVAHSSNAAHHATPASADLRSSPLRFWKHRRALLIVCVGALLLVVLFVSTSGGSATEEANSELSWRQRMHVQQSGVGGGVRGGVSSILRGVFSTSALSDDDVDRALKKQRRAEKKARKKAKKQAEKRRRKKDQHRRDELADAHEDDEDETTATPPRAELVVQQVARASNTLTRVVESSTAAATTTTVAPPSVPPTATPLATTVARTQNLEEFPKAIPIAPTDSVPLPVPVETVRVEVGGDYAQEADPSSEEEETTKSHEKAKKKKHHSKKKKHKKDKHHKSKKEKRDYQPEPVMEPTVQAADPTPAAPSDPVRKLMKRRRAVSQPLTRP